MRSGPCARVSLSAISRIFASAISAYASYWRRTMRLPRLRLRTVPRNTTTPPKASSRTSASASSTESGASLTATGASVRASPPDTGGIRASSSPSASGVSSPAYSRLRAITTWRPSVMSGCSRATRATASRTVEPDGSSRSKWPRPAASRYEANKRTSTCTPRSVAEVRESHARGRQCGLRRPPLRVSRPGQRFLRRRGVLLRPRSTDAARGAVSAGKRARSPRVGHRRSAGRVQLRMAAGCDAGGARTRARRRARARAVDRSGFWLAASGVRGRVRCLHVRGRVRDRHLRDDRGRGAGAKVRRDPARAAARALVRLSAALLLPADVSVHRAGQHERERASSPVRHKAYRGAERSQRRRAEDAHRDLDEEGRPPGKRARDRQPGDGVRGPDRATGHGAAHRNRRGGRRHARLRAARDRKEPPLLPFSGLPGGPRPRHRARPREGPRRRRPRFARQGPRRHAQGPADAGDDAARPGPHRVPPPARAGGDRSRRVRRHRRPRHARGRARAAGRRGSGRVRHRGARVPRGGAGHLRRRWADLTRRRPRAPAARATRRAVRHGRRYGLRPAREARDSRRRRRGRGLSLPGDGCRRAPRGAGARRTRTPAAQGGVAKHARRRRPGFYDEQGTASLFAAGMTSAYTSLVIDLVTSDLALFVFAVVGIAGTAVSIARDTRAQKASLLTEKLPVQLSR